VDALSHGSIRSFVPVARSALKCVPEGQY